MEAQRWRLGMFASCGWFWEDPMRVETRQVLRAAARAARLVDGLAGTDLEARLVADLATFVSPQVGIDGATIFKEEGLRRLAAGETQLEPLVMRLGDVMIRDVRGLHRGTPNLTDAPRPMVVIGYSRRWLSRPEVSIRVPRAILQTLSERARRMLRFNPVVESPEDQPDTEIYQSFAY